MKVHPIVLILFLALGLGLILSGCAGVTPAPSATALPTEAPTQAPSATLAPSGTPVPTATDTTTPTYTPTETSTSTPTVTPSVTPTATRQIYNLPGVHTVDKCGRTTFHYADSTVFDPNGQYSLTMDLCVTTVVVRKDWMMLFNLEWRLISWDGPFPSRYMYAHNDYMALGDDLGNWYTRASDSGPVVDDDRTGGKQNTYIGWYLFPPAANGAKIFTLYDNDKKVAVTGIILKPN
jgi:hypothetical protein